jgi:hypothetical protein
MSSTAPPGVRSLERLTGNRAEHSDRCWSVDVGAEAFGAAFESVFAAQKQPPPAVPVTIEMSRGRSEARPGPRRNGARRAAGERSGQDPGDPGDLDDEPPPPSPHPGRAA